MNQVHLVGKTVVASGRRVFQGRGDSTNFHEIAVGTGNDGRAVIIEGALKFIKHGIIFVQFTQPRTDVIVNGERQQGT